MFYWIMQHMVDSRLQRQVGDFRLISRPALQAIRAFREQHRFMRGLIAWLGLKETIVPFEREARAGGHTKYPLSKMLRFSWTAITSFSALPLRLSTCLGVTFSLLSFGYFLFAVWAALVWRSVVPGWTSLVAIQCFLFGVLFLCMGMIGDYIAKIYEEVKGRPLYIVNETRNLLGAPEIRRALVLHDDEPERAEHQEAASPATAGKLR
jgi:dolichol-phosphate mannosyltransferase